MKKKLLLPLLLLAAILLAAPALAGHSAEGSSYDAGDETSIPNFLFYNMKEGIYCGKCPVYSAPSMDAYRCANGKAMCATDEQLYIGGYEPGGWLMVRYTTNNGGCRVGYIPPKYTKHFKTWHKIEFSYVPETAQTELTVTDNPLSNYDYFAVLEPGETYYILGEYTYHGNWWYIECTVDGMQARGFIAK